MKFKYDQSVFKTPQYAEALALYFYCKYNSLDFYNEIKKRRKNDLNNFPDFIISDRWLEVVRAMDELGGKQQNDITDVFGKLNPLKEIENKKRELEKYNNSDHCITFRQIDGHVYSETNLEDQQSLIIKITNKIQSKYTKYNNRIISEKLDLFVVLYIMLEEDSINEFVSWYKENELSHFFDNVYILFPSEEKNCVLKINLVNCEKKLISSIDKNELAELIFNLKWLDKEKYIKN